MANPAKPKDAKPRAEGDELEIKQPVKNDGNSGGNSLGAIIGVIVLGVVLIIAANYFLIDMKISQVSKTIATATPGEEGEGEEDGESVNAEKGIILDLGEFILNLADSNARKFLKVNVAIELTKKPSDTPVAQKSGGHGEKAPDPMAAVEAEMNQYKPAIRDSVISVLSAKTSDELATISGKEVAKEQIKEGINAIFEGDREVLRVSFGSFFIQ